MSRLSAQCHRTENSMEVSADADNAAADRKVIHMSCFCLAHARQKLYFLSDKILDLTLTIFTSTVELQWLEQAWDHEN